MKKWFKIFIGRIVFEIMKNSFDIKFDVDTSNVYDNRNDCITLKVFLAGKELAQSYFYVPRNNQ